MKFNILNISLLVMISASYIPLLYADNTLIINQKGLKYAHSIENSRFNPGIKASRGIEGNYERIIGEKGVFMKDMVTGATLLVPNAVSTGPKSMETLKAEMPKLLTDDPEKHNAEVKSYLIDAGIPSHEVSETYITATMGGGEVKKGIQPAESKLLWYTTHLKRVLNGIPVEGSYAFATLDAEGNSFSEGVYWPSIPAPVVRKAIALKNKLSSAVEEQQFRGKVKDILPNDSKVEAGEVRIVHTGAGHHGQFEVKAVYSLVARNPNGGKAQIIRLDESGIHTMMGDEIKEATKDSTKEKN